jgi:hypothetical protein
MATMAERQAEREARYTAELAKVDDDHLPALAGSDKQIPWARVIRWNMRQEILEAGWDLAERLEAEGQWELGQIAKDATAAIMEINEAGYWIAKRDDAARTVVEQGIIRAIEEFLETI